MPLRSILEIDIDDRGFRQFQDSFKKYQDALSQMPQQWQKVSAAAGAAHISFTEMAALLFAQTHELRKAVQETDKFGRGIDNAQRHMGLLERTSRQLGRNILEMTRHLLSWGTIWSAATGLVGLGGGLFGLTRLTQTAATASRQAAGIGITYGEQRAFGPAFQRFFGSQEGAQSFLQAITRGKGDITSPESVAMRSILGLSPEQIQRQDPAQLALTVMERLRELPTRFPGLDPNSPMFQTLAERFRLTSLADPASIRRLIQEGTTLPEAERTFRQRQQSGVTQQTVDAMERFLTALSNAKNRLEDALAQGPGGGLLGSLTKLSERFAAAAEAFIKSPAVKHAVDELAAGLERFATYIGTEDFQNNLKTISHGFELLAHSMGFLIEHPAIFGALGGAIVGSRFGPYGAAAGAVIGAGAGLFAETRPDKEEQVTAGPAHERASENVQFFNYGNIRAAGGGWRTFGTPEEGVAAIGTQLDRYASGQTTGKPVRTLSGLIGTYAPPSENPTAALIANASRRTGLLPDEQVNLWDPGVRRKITQAIVEQENPRSVTEAMAAYDRYVSRDKTDKLAEQFDVALRASADIERKRKSETADEFLKRRGRAAFEQMQSPVGIRIFNNTGGAAAVSVGAMAPGG